MKRSGAVTVTVSSLQGPRPQPLSLPPPPSSRPSKRPRVNGGGGGDDDADAGMTRPAAAAGPVIVYEHTPRVIHAKPDEFKALVQRLTGRLQQDPAQPAAETATSSSSSPDEEEATVDPLLVLTLGKQAPPLHGRTPLQLSSSPGGGLAADAGFLFSPGSFLFSPATLQAIQELIS